MSVNRLTHSQDREANRANEPDTSAAKAQDASKMDNDKLRSFFSGLVNKAPTNGPRGA